MSNSNTLDIIQGLAQAAANAWDGSHDGRFTIDEEETKVGLRREEGCPIMDSRVLDGFQVKFYGDMMCVSYQSDIKLKEVYAGGFEQEMESTMTDIKNFLQKEYKKITGNSVTLTKDGDIYVMAQSTSRVRSFVNAHQYYKISGIKPDADAGGSENRTVDDAFRKFLELNNNNKRPQNDTRKKSQ